MSTNLETETATKSLNTDPQMILSKKPTPAVRKRKRDQANLAETRRLDAYFSKQNENNKENASLDRVPQAKKTKTKLDIPDEPKIQMTFKSDMFQRKVNSQPAPKSPRKIFTIQRCHQSQSKTKPPKITSTQTISLRNLRREYFKKFSAKFDNSEYPVFSRMYMLIEQNLLKSKFPTRTFQKIFAGALAVFLSSSSSQLMHSIFRPWFLYELVDDQACKFVIYWINQYFANQKKDDDDLTFSTITELSNSISLHFNLNQQKNEILLPKQYQDSLSQFNYNCLAINGPEGIGKATLILAACKELNYQVIEFSNSSKRSSKELDSILEATQSHNVNKASESLISSAKSVSTKDSYEPKNTERTVIFLRNYDKVLEPDVGFYDKTNKLIKNSKCPIILTSAKQSLAQFDSLEFEGYNEDDLTIIFYIILQLYHNFELPFQQIRKENSAFESSEGVEDLLAKIAESEREIGSDQIKLCGNLMKIRSFIRFQDKNLTRIFTLFDQFKAFFMKDYYESAYSQIYLDRCLPFKTFRWFGELQIENNFLKEVFLRLEQTDKRIVLQYSDILNDSCFTPHEVCHDALLTTMRTVSNDEIGSFEVFEIKSLSSLRSHYKLLNTLGELDALQEKINVFHYDEEVEEILLEKEQGLRKRTPENNELDLEKKWSLNNQLESHFNEISQETMRTHIMFDPDVEPISDQDTFTASLKTSHQERTIRHQNKALRSLILSHGDQLSYIARKDLADFSELMIVLGNTYNQEFQTRSKRKKLQEGKYGDPISEGDLNKQYHFDKSLLARNSRDAELTTNFMRLSQTFYNQEIYDDYMNYLNSI